jgi:hypothetical protein
MINCLGSPFVVSTVVLAALAQPAEEDELVGRQKEAARATWRRLFGEESPADRETDHFLVVGASSLTESRLRDLAAGYEGRYRLARRALGVEAGEMLWPGKLAVFLLPGRPQFNTFMRTIAQKRPGADDVGVFSLKGQNPFVAACPPQGKYDPPLETQAGEQIVAAILSQRGGDRVPGWLTAGFARATGWHAVPASATPDRAQVKRLIRGKTAAAVWDNQLSAEEAVVLRASLVEFLAYGPGAATFPKLVEALRPEANRRVKPMPEVLKAIGTDPARLTLAWQAWVARGR